MSELAIPSPVPTRRVLVVEDDGPTRVALTRLMIQHGYVTWSAVDAIEGLLLLRQHQPDRLLLDLMLPGMPGENMLHAVHAFSPDTRVAVLTGVENEDRLERLADLGADRVIRKPVDLQSLLAWVGAE